MRLAMLEDVYEVSYYYDADGNMTESVVRAQTGDLINIQWTIYINRYYERQIDYVIDTTTSQVVEVDYYYRKYYYAGNTRIAMRYYEDGVPTQYWLLADQVNSQSMTLNEDGTPHSEVRYTAFGETRYTSQTDTPTDYLYTGQRLEEELGLYYYVARFYDPYLNHFLQADTKIPNASFNLSYDRYGYVYFNPLIFTDPDGHTGCSAWMDGKNCGNKAVQNDGTIKYAPTILDFSEQTTAGTSGISPAAFYNNYIQDWLNSSSISWEIFGNDGTYAITDYMSLVLWRESSNNPDTLRKLAEPNMRVAFQKTGVVYDLAQIVIAFVYYNEAARSLNPNDLSYLSEIPVAALLRVAGLLKDPPAAWYTGWERDASYGYGNFSLYDGYSKIKVEIANHTDLLDVYIADGNHTFFIGSGCVMKVINSLKGENNGWTWSDCR